MTSNLNNFVGNDNGNHQQTTSTIQVAVYDVGGSAQDGSFVTISIHGDLA